MALVVLILIVAAAAALRRSSIGRTIIAVRDNEPAIASFGVRPATVKLQILRYRGLSRSGGRVLCGGLGELSPSYFTADASIAILAIPVVGGLGSLGGAIAAAVLLYMSTFFVGPHISGLLGSVGQNVRSLLLLGGGSVIASMMQFPTGIAGKVQELWQAHLNKRAAIFATKGRSLVPAGEALASGDQGMAVATGSALQRAAASPSFATIGRQEDGRKGRNTLPYRCPMRCRCLLTKWQSISEASLPSTE